MAEPLSQDFAGRVTIVTGGCGGIGEATVRHFAARGASVVIADVDADALTRLAASIEAPGGSLPCPTDVTDPASCEALVARAAEHFGGVDVLANVVGGSRPGQTAVDLSPEAWHAVVDLNLTSTFLASRAAIPAMAARGGGAIVNVASGAGVRGMQRNPAYVAAKGGVIALTRALAMDHAGEGIRVNCVSPGPVLTPLMERNRTPEEIEVIARQSISERLGDPAELAAAIGFLASEAASYIQGETIHVDGGFATLV